MSRSYRFRNRDNTPDDFIRHSKRSSFSYTFMGIPYFFIMKRDEDTDDVVELSKIEMRRQSIIGANKAFRRTENKRKRRGVKLKLKAIERLESYEESGKLLSEIVTEKNDCDYNYF